MSTRDTRTPRRGRPAKVDAVLRAACEVFGRDGYTRAGMETIAAEAGVSTRTLYNHFPGGKAELFRTVMAWSSTHVRDAQLALLHRYLDPERPPRPQDLERDLVLLARSWTNLTAEFPAHFAMVRQIHAEIGHIPDDVREAWQDTGPRTVTRETARVLSALAALGLLDLHGDPERTARHFALLTSGELAQLTFWAYAPLPDPEADAIITAGVRTFLRAYTPAPPRPNPGTASR
ncbi:TetR/AcrR family transcriptional regulator [Actinocorallia sp. A-T 12471]|uniref:TetR/AcrR family transcriptional regulator n=1 Tax=Actinocorallia sp. A-T 12471 TaxID=3089813 RepID=UPI0029D2B486|nr:TetR/AcrR family transcriptional regulator [Actinocorallia sp. A-T 12471]MDX6744355.1 TetR/AcrR family transcriptional regulator [Actinocorallia sp. A-T 12471]